MTEEKTPLSNVGYAPVTPAINRNGDRSGLNAANPSTWNSTKRFFKYCCGNLRSLVLVALIAFFALYWTHPAPGMEDPRVKLVDDFLEGMVKYYKGNISRASDNWHNNSRANLQPLIDKVARALVWQDTFKVGQIGSSVAAGHDNCHLDAWQNQFERFMGPLWKKLGVELIVRNAGQGGGCGDNQHNQVFCLKQMLGQVDVAAYEWTYFGWSDVAHERFIRYALLSGAVPYVTQTGGDGRSGAMESQYFPFGFDFNIMMNGHKKHNYVKPKGFWGAKGNGLYNTTRYANEEWVSDDHRNELGKVFMNWHPGPLGHESYSDAFAWKIATAMKEALVQIAAEDLPRWRWPQKRTFLLASELPDPVVCKPEECNVVPECRNFETPTYGPSAIFVPLAKDDSMNPYRNEKGNDTWYLKNDMGTSSLMPRWAHRNPQCKHLDKCSHYRNVPGESFLTIRLPRMTLGRIAICLMGNRNALSSFTIKIEQKVINTTAAPGMGGTKKACLVLQERFDESMTFAYGHIHLGIYSPPENKQILQLTHVITI